MKVRCDGCGNQVGLDGEGRYITHSKVDGHRIEWRTGYNRPGCENGGLMPIEGIPSGSVYEISAGHWESNRRKH